MSRLRLWKQVLLALAAGCGEAQTASAQPANDDFVNATFITGYAAQVTGTNTGAGTQGGEPSHAGISDGHSAWWRWTAPASGNVAIDTMGSSFDTVLAVYTGSQLGGLGTKAANNNSGGGLASAVAFNAARGEMYLIAVDGVGGATGEIVLNLSLTPELANDLFANATVITGATLQTSGNLSAAGAEPGEPAHGGDGPTQSVWWRWTAPADGPVMVRKSGAAPADLAVYSGNSLPALQPVAGPDPDAGTTAIYFNATAGTSYALALDAKFVSSDTYFFWFNANVVPPALGQSPANVTAPLGGAVNFRATAFGNPKPAFQWQRKLAGASEWQNLSDGPDRTGAATPTLQITGVTLSMSGDEFRCVFSNSGGNTTSGVARLTVRPVAAPGIVGQPASTITGIPGKTVFTGSDGGSPAAGYLWQRAPLNSAEWTDYGATPTLALTLPAAADFGYQYRAVAHNSEGSAYSLAATAALRQSLAIFPLLEANTTLTIFGSLSFAELPPQTFSPGIEGVVALAAGRSHVVALKSDGTVAGWGDPYGGSFPVPADLAAPGANVVSLSSWYGAYALRADGTARVWEGGNPNASTTGGTLETVMSQGYRLGIQINGTVFQSGTGPLSQPAMSSAVTNTIAVAGGYATAYALHGNGTVSGWGLLQSFNGTVPAGLANVVALAVNDKNAIALKADGTVAQWGANVPAPPADLANVVAVAAGYRHALALRRDGTVVAWGENPSLVSLSQSLDHVVAISAGSWNSAILQKNTWDLPVIVSHPRSRMLSGNASTLLYVGAVGPGNLTYQWYQDSLDNPIPGATSAAYLTPVLTSPTAYYVKVSNAFGAAVSAPATIIAGSPPSSAGALPTFVSQPSSQTVGYEAAGNLSVDAVPAELTYQWFQGARGDTSTPVGANSANFTTPLLTENATYWVRASNAAGSANSQAAQFTVLSPSATLAAALGLSGPDLAPEATPFADGLPNLLRYALNLGAMPGAGQLPGGSYETVGGVTYFKLQFRQRKNLSGVALVTQFSNNLSTWQDVPAENLTQLPDDDAATERWEVRLPVPPGGRVFLRLRATED